MRKRILQFLVVALALSPLTVKADTTQTFTDTTGVTSNPTTVTLSKDASYSVTVPKELTLSSSGTASYSVLVTGDVLSSTVITVEPVDEVEDTEGINFQITEALGLKSPLVATVTQDKQQFAYDEIAAGSTTSGTITCPGLSAGNWSGILKFNISSGIQSGPVTRAAGLYDASGNLTKSWDELVAENSIQVNSNSIYGVSSGLQGELVISNTISTIDTDSFNSSGLTKVVIPESVTTISDCAFNECCSLTEINIPKSVTYIEPGAFNYCSSLTSITVDVNNTTYDSRDNCNAIIETSSNTMIAGCVNTAIPSSVTGLEYTFGGVEGLTSITIPDTVRYIGTSVFADCCDLSTVVLPNQLPRLANGVFSGCTSLQNISIPSTVESIGDGTFRNCTSLANIAIPNSVSSIGSSAFGGCTSLSSINLPNIPNISPGTFMGCSNLSAIVVPDTVTSIGRQAFMNCTALADITIPTSVSEIGAQAFEGCTSLSNINVPTSVTTISNGAFKNVPCITYGGSATGSPWGALKVVKPAGLYNSADVMTKSWDELESAGAFEIIEEGLLWLDVDIAGQLVVSDSITSLAESVFCDCTELTEVILPDTISEIPAEAFLSCSSLTNVNIPKSTTYVSSSAFGGNDSLISITVDRDNTTYDSRNNCNAVMETATDTLVLACKNTVIPDDTKIIGSGAFFGIKDITEVVLPVTVTKICGAAFSGCTSLNSITIPESVISIGNSAFKGCKDLTQIEIPRSVNIIGPQAFAGCSRLKYVTIPSTITTIEAMAFADCISLEPVYVPSTLLEVGSGAFMNVPCVVYLSNTDISSWGAQHAIKEAGVYDSNYTLTKSWDTLVTQGVFTVGTVSGEFDTRMDASSILNGTLVLSESVKSLAVDSLSGCDGLVRVILPKSVTYISDNALGVCENLEYVSMQDTVTEIEGVAMGGSTKIANIIIPRSVQTIGDAAFEDVQHITYYGSASGSPWGALSIN